MPVSYLVSKLRVIAVVDALGGCQRVEQVRSCVRLELERIQVVVRARDEVLEREPALRLQRGDHCRSSAHARQATRRQHVLWYALVNSSASMACTTVAMSRGCGAPVQLYTSVSLVRAYAAWHACSTFSARRMSPRASLSSAARPSGVMSTLQCTC
jgi:hypothetical protein